MRLHKVVLRVLIEVEVGVEDLHEEVQILRLRHADLRRFERLAELGHDLLSLLSARAEVEIGGVGDRLGLQILLEQLVRIADRIGTQSVKVFTTEARERVQR